MSAPIIPQIVRSFKFCLRPTRAQHLALEAICESQRQLYHAALTERIDCYRKTGKSISYFDQCASLTICRRDNADMGALPLSLQRATLKRLDEAFAGFFRRVKTKGKAGFPRYKGRDWWTSFAFREFSGIRFDGGARLRFKGLPGALRVHLHRPLPPGDILGCSFKRTPKGWHVSLQVRIEATRLPATGKSVGLDVGLTHLATLSTGETIPNLRHTKRMAKALRRRQRALARCKRGSNNRRKAKERVARLHARVANARDTYLHQVAARLVNGHDVIAIENLNVKGLASGMLAKSVNDAAWAKFRFHMTAKAEGAGRTVVAVNPRNTSQECSTCGAIAKKTLAQRVHSCDKCGLTMDRDHNAALVILHRAVVRPSVVNVAECSKRRRRNAALEGISK